MIFNSCRPDNHSTLPVIQQLKATVILAQPTRLADPLNHLYDILAHTQAALEYLICVIVVSASEHHGLTNNVSRLLILRFSILQSLESLRKLIQYLGTDCGN